MSKRSQPSDLSRRDFLRLTGVMAAGLLVNGCQPEQTTPSATQAATQAPVSKPAVAIGQARTYDRATIESQVRALIDHLGGLGDVVKPGDTVAIKPNLTGGTSSQPVPGVRPEDSFVTHPEVVRALVKEVKAAGAKEIVESQASASNTIRSVPPGAIAKCCSTVMGICEIGSGLPYSS